VFPLPDSKIFPPVSMGGDNFDLKNLQTLCHECHVNKTIKDMARLRESVALPTVVRDFYEFLERVDKKVRQWERWTGTR
jgi:hypothetical protein